MSATFASSLIVFTGTGLYAVWASIMRQSPTGLPMVDFILSLTIIINAIFFFYLELYAETDKKEKERLRLKNPLQWWLRVFNSANLSIIWIWLTIGLYYFLISFISLYIFILIWDVITTENPIQINFDDKNNRQESRLEYIKHDTIGFFLTLILAAILFLYKHAQEDKDFLSSYLSSYHQILGNSGDSVLRNLDVVLAVVCAGCIVNLIIVIKKVNLPIYVLLKKESRH